MKSCFQNINVGDKVEISIPPDWARQEFPVVDIGVTTIRNTVTIGSNIKVPHMYFQRSTNHFSSLRYNYDFFCDIYYTDILKIIKNKV